MDRQKKIDGWFDASKKMMIGWMDRKKIDRWMDTKQMHG